jgi:hypothetical protein
MTDRLFCVGKKFFSQPAINFVRGYLIEISFFFCYIYVYNLDQTGGNMSEILIEKNEFATLWYHPEKKIVHHQFHKFIYGDVFRNLLLKGTETMKKYGANKWLSDDRKNPVLKTDDSDWAQANWFPLTLQAGWKYWALVQPEGAIAKINTDKLVKIYGEAGVIAKYFENPEDAMKWIESQP